ncbi:tRNA nucleotidyltransferase [Bradyrhizobium sp.]|uniref:tRNA nucleotidyltransferase n=1 Tax=Bradyrhizobium sp. TaxID=376 RepID=UPI003C55D68C
MTGASKGFASEWLQRHRGLGLLRLAALYADADGIPDQETIDAIALILEAGALADTSPCPMWPELAGGLMDRQPGTMIWVLRESGVLQAILPEIADLFGVPQIADDPSEVDLGVHLMRTLNETARLGAPLEVRFAALVMNVGKSDSPVEHLPVHYRHVERGGPRIEGICARFGVPDACRDMAMLALTESERVHRVSSIRAGPIAAMLERLGAFDRPARFRNLLLLCLCDYNAYARLLERPYGKSAILEAALAACGEIDHDDTIEAIGDAAFADWLRSARAGAIAEALRSLRWPTD